MTADNSAVSMMDVVRMLTETYKDDGVAIMLGAQVVLRPHHGAEPVWSVCRTAEGRRIVYDWAESLTGMVAS